jgi:hypothetical protein
MQQGAVVSETVLDDDYEDYEYEPGELFNILMECDDMKEQFRTHFI